jgi:Uncharacterized conserved protein, contains double-stranded beta-helix domain
MATVLKSNKREFEENPGRIDNFRLLSDVSRIKSGIEPQNLNFDLRQLNPGQYSSLYHFHRHAEELFMIITGSATLRTPEGLEVVNSGDLLFFEKGETGAHQLYNHTDEICVFLDIRTFFDSDVCEYPDSNRLLIVPTMERFNKDDATGCFDGEENIKEVWKQLKVKQT